MLPIYDTLYQNVFERILQMIKRLLFTSLLTLTVLFQFTPANSVYAAENNETPEYEDINKKPFLPYQTEPYDTSYC